MITVNKKKRSCNSSNYKRIEVTEVFLGGELRNEWEKSLQLVIVREEIEVSKAQKKSLHMNSQKTIASMQIRKMFRI
jgi:hypothetical protein